MIQVRQRLQKNPPLLLVVTGDSGKVSPPKVMVTVELGENPVPVISTGGPKGPEVGLSVITDPTVNVFEADLDPSVVQPYDLHWRTVVR